MKHKRNLVPVETSDGACYQVTINGADDVTIIQGADFDPTDGVVAYDGYGDEIDFSFSPSEIAECEVGKQTIRYSATGYGTRAKPHFPCRRKNILHIIDDGGDDTDTAVVYRTITVKQADPPTISGVSDTTIQPNTNFNPLNGVSAVDAHGNTVDVEYSGSYDLEATGNPAVFEADATTGIKSLQVALEPIQSGSGTPSPDNVRAISGHTTVETHITDSTYTTDLGRTVYGGTLDVVSGVLTVDKAFITMLGTSGTQTAGTKMNKSSTTTANIFYTFNSNNGLYPTSLTDTDDLVCSHFPTGLASSTTEAQCYMGLAQFRICLPLDNSLGISTAAEMNAWLAEQYANGTPVQFAIRLLNPQTYQLTPQEVEALVGTNTVWSDGNVTVQYSHQIPQGTFQYPVEGIYSITYTASDKCGNTRTETRKVYCATEIQFVIPSGQAGYGHYVGIQTVEPNKRYLVETNIPYSDTSELQFYNNYTPDNPGFIVYEGESVTFETPSSDGSQKQVVAFCNGALRAALENDTYRVKIYEIGNIYTSI